MLAFGLFRGEILLNILTFNQHLWIDIFSTANCATAYFLVSTTKCEQILPKTIQYAKMKEKQGIPYFLGLFLSVKSVLLNENFRDMWKIWKCLFMLDVGLSIKLPPFLIRVKTKNTEHKLCKNDELDYEKQIFNRKHTKNLSVEWGTSKNFHLRISKFK